MRGDTRAGRRLRDDEDAGRAQRSSTPPLGLLCAEWHRPAPNLPLPPSESQHGTTEDQRRSLSGPEAGSEEMAVDAEMQRALSLGFAMSDCIASGSADHEELIFRYRQWEESDSFGLSACELLTNFLAATVLLASSTPTPRRIPPQPRAFAATMD